MKKELIIVALAVVLFAALAQAQDKPKEPLTMEQQYAQARIAQINAEFQLFQMDLRAMAQKYPEYRKELEALLNEVVKRLQPELQELQKKLAPPPAKPVEPKK